MKKKGKWKKVKNDAKGLKSNPAWGKCDREGFPVLNAFSRPIFQLLRRVELLDFYFRFDDDFLATKKKLLVLKKASFPSCEGCRCCCRRSAVLVSAPWLVICRRGLRLSACELTAPDAHFELVSLRGGGDRPWMSCARRQRFGSS